MSLFPYDDEEERRRLALTPGINPNAPALPNIPSPRRRPLPRPVPGIPGGVEPSGMPGAPAPSPIPETVIPRGMPLATRGIPEATPMPGLPPDLADAATIPQTRGRQLQTARDTYLMNTPGRFKSAALGALRGFTHGGGLGGAITGAAYGGIDPRGLREAEFQEKVRPKIYEGWALEDQDRAMQTAAHKAMREDQNTQSQIRQREAEAALNQKKFDYESNKPINVAPGASVYDPRTKQSVFTAPERTRPADQAAQIEAALNAEQGTVEEQSQGSLQGRIEMLKKHLNPDEKRIIEGGATSSDLPDTINRAWSRWNKIKDDELGSIRRVTGEKRKAEVSNRRLGRKGTPGRTTISSVEADSLLPPAAK